MPLMDVLKLQFPLNTLRASFLSNQLLSFSFNVSTWSMMYYRRKWRDNTFVLIGCEREMDFEVYLFISSLKLLCFSFSALVFC